MSGGSPQRTWSVFLWTGRVLSALPALMLTLSGVMKLLQPAAVIEGFTKLGWLTDLAFPLGIVELACVVLYVTPRTTVLGAILITGYLGGATATHVRVGDPWFGPVLIGVFVWLGLWFREPRLRSLIPLRWG